jgi:hypothetical protein
MRDSESGMTFFVSAFKPGSMATGSLIAVHGHDLVRIGILWAGGFVRMASKG